MINEILQPVQYTIVICIACFSDAEEYLTV